MRILGWLLPIVALTSLSAAAAVAADTPGVTATEIKIGQTMPYSGALSLWGVVGRAEEAYFSMINQQGGIDGRKLTLISLDDAYSPPKTVEQTRKLVEQDGVAFIYNALGVSSGLAVRRYLNDRHVPQLFPLAPVEAMNDPKRFPWSTAAPLPTLGLYAQLVGQYIVKHKPDAKIAILYQHDESGKETLSGLKKGLGNRAGAVIKEASYEVSDVTVDSQIIELQASGADVFFNGSAPKFAAQAIRRAYDLGWRPLEFIGYTAQSISATLKPAGLDRSIGLMAAAYVKDPTDPQWENDPDMRRYFAWLDEHYPTGSREDSFVYVGYFNATFLVELLKLCGGDFSRENIMRQATTLHDLELPLLLPGIKFSTSPTDYRPIKQMRYVRFNGERWELLDEMPAVPSD